MILICLTFYARENKLRGSLNFSIIYLSTLFHHNKKTTEKMLSIVVKVTYMQWPTKLVDGGYEESGCDDIAYFFLCLQK